MEPIRVLHNIVLMDAGGIETLVMNLYRHIDKMNEKTNTSSRTELIHYYHNWTK